MKLLNFIFTFLFSPIMIIGHILTNHPGFMFLLGAANTIGIFIILVSGGIIALAFWSKSNSAVDGAITAIEKIKQDLVKFPLWKFVIGWTYVLTGLAYSIYVLSFFVASTFIVHMFISGGLLYIRLNNKENAQAS